MAKQTYYIPGPANINPTTYCDEYESWEIEEGDIIEALTDPSMADEAAITVLKLLKKVELGNKVLPIAIKALEQVLEGIQWEGMEYDIIKLTLKALKSEYKYNKWNYQ